MFQNNFSCIFSGVKLRNCANLNKIGPIVFSQDWIQKRQINNDNITKVLNHFFGLREPYNSNSLENSTTEYLRTKYFLYCEKVNSNNKGIISDTFYPEAFDFLDISRCPCVYNEPFTANIVFRSVLSPWNIKLDLEGVDVKAEMAG